MSSRISSYLELHRRIDPITLKNELERIFPQHTVTYSVMTDSFQIRQPRMSHTLQYNTHKASRLESQHRVTRRFTLYFNLVVLGLLFLVVVLDRQMNWELIPHPLFPSDGYYIGLILLLGLMQYLIPVLKPGLKRELGAEHVKVRKTMEELFM